VVCCVTGAGFKTIEVFPPPENTIRIPPNFQSLRAAIGPLLR
jgi:threonine synthase